jgi:hypothetical protein
VFKLFIFQGSKHESNYGAGAAIIAESIEQAEMLLNEREDARHRAEGYSHKRIHTYLRATEEECAALCWGGIKSLGGSGNTLVLAETFDMPHDSPRVVMFQENWA